MLGFDYQFVKRYSSYLQLAVTATDAQTAFDNGLIGSMLGIEGGHQIDSSFGALRQFYDLGVRYMTLTHTCNTPWAVRYRYFAGVIARLRLIF